MLIFNLAVRSANARCPLVLLHLTTSAHCSIPGMMVMHNQQTLWIASQRNEALNPLICSLLGCKLFKCLRWWKVNRRTRKIRSTLIQSRRRIQGKRTKYWQTRKSVAMEKKTGIQECHNEWGRTTIRRKRLNGEVLRKRKNAGRTKRTITEITRKQRTRENRFLNGKRKPYKNEERQEKIAHEPYASKEKLISTMLLSNTNYCNHTGYWTTWSI